MKNDSEHDRLLNDVLGESASAEFRAETLARTLKQVRRKDQGQQWGRGMLAAGLMMGVGLLVWHNRVPQQRAMAVAPASFLNQVSSQPLEAGMMVTTAADAFTTLTVVASTRSVREISSSGAGLHELDDDQLLGLMKETPSVLIRQGPHEAELLIVGADDRIVSPGAESDQ